MGYPSYHLAELHRLRLAPRRTIIRRHNTTRRIDFFTLDQGTVCAIDLRAF